MDDAGESNQGELYIFLVSFRLVGLKFKLKLEIMIFLIPLLGICDMSSHIMPIVAVVGEIEGRKED